MIFLSALINTSQSVHDQGTKKDSYVKKKNHKNKGICNTNYTRIIEKDDKQTC